MTLLFTPHTDRKTQFSEPILPGLGCLFNQSSSNQVKVFYFAFALLMHNTAVGGSRFWFWVPFRQNGIKNGINLNCDWTILFHFLFHAVSSPKRKRINNYIGIFYSKGHTSTFGCKKENVWCTYRKFAKLLENNMEAL